MRSWWVVCLLLFVGSGFVGSGCQTVSKKMVLEPASEVTISQPVMLRISGKQRTETTQYRSRMMSKTYEDGTLRREKSGDGEFTVETIFLGMDGNTDNIKFVTQTVKRDGPMDLHEMAFPELGESLEMVVAPDGTVMKAGHYSAGSIFFVPSVTLPDRTVQQGDTWTMDAQWVSMQNNVPLKLNVVAILKRFIKYHNEICADLELAGEVSFLEGVLEKTPEFRSKIGGRMYVAINTGSILWSQLNNEEKLVMPDVMVEVQSSLSAHLIKVTSK